MSTRLRLPFPNLLRRRGSSSGRNNTEVEVPAQDVGASAVAPSQDEIEERRLKTVKSASGMSSKDLRKSIQEVQQDESIPPGEKAKRIQELMTFSWRKSQELSRESNPKVKRIGSYGSMKIKRTSNPSLSRTQSSGELLGRSGPFGEEELRDAENYDTDNMNLDSPSADTEYIMQTFQDPNQTVMGCEHYERKCMISAPCCDEFYTCRFCHDESADHEIDRNSINRVRCMNCGTTQGVGKTCISCNIDMGRYFCEHCKFYDDKEGKQIYHCEHCNICRIGSGLGVDYFHCHRCNACMSITLKDHKCVERSLESDCPVCHEFMFTSTLPVMFLPCGHCMHVSCYESYTANDYTCPVCSKSLGNMDSYFRRIDASLAREIMPKEFLGMRNRICCADCEVRSIAPYHFLYHKCCSCGSYNTKVLEQMPKVAVKPPPPRWR